MKNVLVFLLLSLCLFSCGNDDSIENVNTEEAIMEVEKNGVLFTVTSFNNTLEEVVEEGEVARRLDIRGEVDGGTLFVSISNWDWQNPPANGVLEKSYDTDDTFDVGPNTECLAASNVTYCDTGLGTYLVGTNIYMTGISEEAEAGTITISKNDSNNRTVSGSFEFVSSDLFMTEEFSFKGTFRNLKY